VGEIVNVALGLRPNLFEPQARRYSKLRQHLWQFQLTMAPFEMLWEKRRRAAALQDAVRDMMIPEIREASWTAPALWRFATFL
jgi:hypothetical protein